MYIQHMTIEISPKLASMRQFFVRSPVSHSYQTMFALYTNYLTLSPDCFFDEPCFVVALSMIDAFECAS